MRGLRNGDLRYKARYSMRWRAEGRTIARLKRDGFTVFRIAHPQRRKFREYETELPGEATLIATDGAKAKIIIVNSGKKLAEGRRAKMREFGRRAKPFAMEVWTWPVMAREPEIERIA